MSFLGTVHTDNKIVVGLSSRRTLPLGIANYIGIYVHRCWWSSRCRAGEDWVPSIWSLRSIRPLVCCTKSLSKYPFVVTRPTSSLTLPIWWMTCDNTLSILVSYLAVDQRQILSPHQVAFLEVLRKTYSEKFADNGKQVLCMSYLYLEMFCWQLIYFISSLGWSLSYCTDCADLMLRQLIHANNCIQTKWFNRMRLAKNFTLFICISSLCRPYLLSESDVELMSNIDEGNKVMPKNEIGSKWNDITKRRDKASHKMHQDHTQIHMSSLWATSIWKDKGNTKEPNRKQMKRHNWTKG